MKIMVWGTVVLPALAGAGLAAFAMQPPAALQAASAQVSRIGEMSVARAAHQATRLDSGKVLITGGCAGQCDSVLASVELFDPETRSFQAVAAMHSPRVSHAAVRLNNGDVLVVGGWTGERATAAAEVYDPTTGEWILEVSMNAARIGPVATLLADGRVLITGGEASVGEPLDSAEVFNPETRAFTAVASMGSPRMSHTAVLLPDGRVLIAGGHRARGKVLLSAEIFDPATSMFQPTGELNLPRHKHAAIRLSNGKVMVFGGSNAKDYRGRYRSTALYDPASGEFAPGPRMLWPRHKFRDAVATLPSGKMLIAGGAVRPELFHPTENVFVPIEGSLSGPQMFATATILPSGEVLILGGYDDHIRSSASAWLVSLEP